MRMVDGSVRVFVLLLRCTWATTHSLGGCRKTGRSIKLEGTRTMRTKSTFLVTAAVVVVALLVGTSAEAQLAKQGKYRGTFGYWAVGTVHELEKGHIFWVGDFSGVFFDDVANGFIDKTSVSCAGVNDFLDGVSIAGHGYCVVTDKDGDKAYFGFKGKGTGGDFQWTSGTGKYTGIRGNNTYRFTGIGDTPRGYAVWEGDWQLP